MSKKAFIITIIILAVAITIASFGYMMLSDYINPTGDISTDKITEARKENEAVPSSTPSVPNFIVTNTDGNSISFDSVLGKPVVINFWATWCGPCVSEMPHFQKMYEQFGNEVNFMMINLTDGSRETINGVKNYIAQNGYTFPVYFDTAFNASRIFDTSAIPLSVFIDSNGAYLGSHVGAMNEALLSQYIKALIGE